MKTIIKTIGIIFCFSSNVSAAQIPLNIDQLLSGGIIKKNPFLPQPFVEKITDNTEDLVVLPQEEIPPSEQETVVDNAQRNEGFSMADDISMKTTMNVLPLPNLVISGLIWDSTRPQAIINETVVDVGDIISEAKIVRIDNQGIEIEYQGMTTIINP